MDNTKIEYLKRHLQQALNEDNYNEANNCYHELLKLVDEDDIKDIAKTMSEYNRTHSKSTTQDNDTSGVALKEKVRSIKKKYNQNSQLAKWSFIAWGIGMGLGLLLVMMGAGAFGSYNDAIMYTGLVIAIIGFVALIPGVTGVSTKNKCDVAMKNLKQLLFDFVCEQEPKLQYIEGVQYTDGIYYMGQFPTIYKGQIENEEANGFGVAFVGTGFYAGEWKKNMPCGIGKLYSYDLLYIIEGEFKSGSPDGLVDIVWEDGGEWHGSYKNALPWSGQGKAEIKGKIVEGTWKNGILLA